jgi:BirA family biotin operon repressor/biotin-[acetyl-CoA-carboxylase] ligase
MVKEENYKNFTISHYQEIDSSNKLAQELIALNKIHHNHIIRADRQTAGKGRYGRVWQSPMGNLYFSLVLKPNKNLVLASQLSFLGAVAMGLAITQAGGAVQYKWPNDILLDGKKIAGLLLESTGNGEFIIIGIGVNINSHPDNSPIQAYPATDLKASGVEISREILLKNFLNNFSDLYQTWQDFGFSAIRNLWLKSAFNFNKIIAVNLPDKKLTGRFIDLDQNGNLVLELENKEVKLISSGEIYSL